MDLTWKNGKLAGTVIHNTAGKSRVQVLYADRTVSLTFDAGASQTIDTLQVPAKKVRRSG